MPVKRPHERSRSEKKPQRIERPRLTPEAVAAEKERSQAGTRRRGLFFRPPSRNGQAVPFTQKMRFLPAFDNRGPDGLVRPFFLIGQHWIQRTNDEGEEYGAGITCTDFMQEEQPHAWQKYKKAKVDAALEEERCLFCEILEELRQDEGEEEEPTWHESLPIGNFGSSPAWVRRYAHNFAILLPEEYYEKDEEGDTKVKIYPAPRSVKDGLYAFLDKKQFLSLFDSGKLGWDVDVERFRKGRGPWNYSVTPVEQCPIWYDDWEDELPDLEEVSPNWLSREEAVEWMAENHPEVIDAAGIPSLRRRSKMAHKKSSGKAGRKTTAKKGGSARAGSSKATKATASKKPKKSEDEEEEDED